MRDAPLTFRYLALNNFTWNWITHSTLWLTIIVFMIFISISISTDQFTEPLIFAKPSLVHQIFSTPIFYLSLVFAIVASLLPRAIFKFAQQLVFPSDTDILQEYQVLYWRDGEVVDLANPLGPKEPSIRSSQASLQPITSLKRNSFRNSNIPREMLFHPDRTVPQTLKDRVAQPFKRLKNMLKKTISGGMATRPIVTMGSPMVEERNTGFAFSHDEGMEGRLVGKR